VSWALGMGRWRVEHRDAHVHGLAGVEHTARAARPAGDGVGVAATGLLLASTWTSAAQDTLATSWTGAGGLASLVDGGDGVTSATARVPLLLPLRPVVRDGQSWR